MERGGCNVARIATTCDNFMNATLLHHTLKIKEKRKNFALDAFLFNQFHSVAAVTIDSTHVEQQTWTLIFGYVSVQDLLQRLAER